MALQIFNTLSKRKEMFTPIQPGCIKMYVCGPTVYDDFHLGHARSAVVFDVIVRYLRVLGYGVTYVRNITDIDDKILRKARQQGGDYKVLTDRYIRRYTEDMHRLNIIPPDTEPRVSEFIPSIIEFILHLIQGGHAYSSGGNVYFAVQSFKKYGKLSGRIGQIASGRVNISQDINKKHQADFALWKKAEPTEPSWTSPWGFGRPGWHIECSAMSTKLLGRQFDIHGGGVDLMFPHHENEIAQSESLFNKIPATYWIHNGLVNIGSKKISKSLGNFQTLNELLQMYPPDAVRLYLLSKRYRHPIDFSHRHLSSAVQSMKRLYRLLSRIEAPTPIPSTIEKHRSPLLQKFCLAMDDDFNFPRALSVVFEAVRDINRKNPIKSNNDFLKHSDALKMSASDLLLICQNILGFSLNQPIFDCSG